MRVRISPCSAPLPAPLVQRPAGQSHGWQSMFSYPNSCPGTPPHTQHHSGGGTKLRYPINHRLRAEPSFLLEPPPAPGQEDGTTPWIFGRRIHSGVRQQMNMHAGHPVTGAIHTHTHTHTHVGDSYTKQKGLHSTTNISAFCSDCA